jgi:hypothetical protein
MMVLVRVGCCEEDRLICHLFPLQIHGLAPVTEVGVVREFALAGVAPQAAETPFSDLCCKLKEVL